jgi:hypothetical protein
MVSFTAMADDGDGGPATSTPECELELELIQTQMTQKPMLRAEVYARALRASQNRKEDSL